MTLARAARRAGLLAIACGLGLVLASELHPYDARALDPARGGPLVIEDRRGVVLRSVPARDGRPGREHWVPLTRIATPAVMTLIASEDQRFFEHAGVDAEAVGRALWLNARSLFAGREQLYGASTLTMQLVRMVHSRGAPRTLARKLYESALALRLERVLDKQAILEQYLNRAYYGRGAYGIEAAARRYFDKPAAALSTAEATLLCVVPRSPSAYDPIAHLPRALARRDHVLELLVRQDKLTQDAARQVRRQPIALRERTPADRAPHFVDYVLAELPEALRDAGGRVRTTLDAELQALLERRVAEHVDDLRERGVEQAGALVLDTQRGEVLAMVGSASYRDQQLNITTWRRHPGSALKPFVYAAAIEHGASPATLAYDVYDVPSRYTVRERPPREHGPARYRRALAGSYNLAAVHVLERVGEARVIDRLRLAGVGVLPGDPSDYGLRLALGSTKVRLLDLASAYGVFARAGMAKRARAVAYVERFDGSRAPLPEPDETRAFSAETSALVLDMLADARARTEVFGHDLPSDLPYPVAVKTGTARGFSDNVAVFLTRELTAAAWNGRFDGHATRGVLGMEGAAPLARAALLAASRGRTLSLPAPPASLVRREVCALSGMAPTSACGERISERFVQGRAPSTPCTFHEHTESGTRVVYPSELRGWAKRHKHAVREGS